MVGWVNLLINGPARSAEVGYWLGVGFEGRGLVTRAVTALLDHAFGRIRSAIRPTRRTACIA
nr:GNAT family N-acetyltransferase [Actinacidiphila oryziradicis]